MASTAAQLKCGACKKDCQNLFACTTCKDPLFVLCSTCEPASLTYHHWRHSFLLIENYDTNKQIKTPKFVDDLITNNNLQDEAYNTIITKKHAQKCDCCLGSIYGIKYQSVPTSTTDKNVNLCDSCFHSSHRQDDPQWSQIFLWMKTRSLFMLTQQPLKSFDAVDLKQDLVNNVPPAVLTTPAPSSTKSSGAVKKSDGYEYNAEDKAQGRYTLYEPNSEKGDDDVDSQPGKRAGVYLKSGESSQAPDKGRYEDNEELYKDSYEDNEEQKTTKQSKGYYDDNRDDSYSYNKTGAYEDNEEKQISNKSKGYYEDSDGYNTEKTPTKKGAYEDNNDEPNSKGYYDDSSKDASYSYNTDSNKVPQSKGSYEDNEEQKGSSLKGYYEDNRYDAEKQPSPKSKGYEENREDSYSYNTEKAPSSAKSKGYYEDSKEDSYSYNTEKEPSAKSKGYYEDSQSDPYGYNTDESNTGKSESKSTDASKVTPKTEYDDGYAYNSSRSEAQYTQNPTDDGYGNDDSYGYNTQTEGNTYMDNTESPAKKQEAYVDEDYESTDSDHSDSEPFDVHEDGYLQGDEDATDGYGAHYKDRTGFYKDNEKRPLDASQPAPIPVHAPRPVAPAANGARDWNEEFQNIQTMDDSTPETALEKLYRMHQLSKEFTEKAVKLGKTIIEEVDKPADQKTIKPKNMGGVAGGEKYSEQGIFFKFAIDLFKIYGGDEFAIKAAGLELQGLKCLLQTGIKGLHYPLMILIDYRGYRLIATSMLPLDANSLIYGSGDGAKTIKKEDKAFSKLMKQVGAKLNLKKHQVGFGAITKRLYAPADIEGHRGKDGRYYLLDTARLFPAEPPTRNLTGLLIRAHDRTRDERWQPLPEISFVPSLVADKLMRQLDEYLNSDYEVPVKIESEEFLDGTMYYTNRGPVNIRASTLLGKVIQGDVVLVMKGRKGSFLYNLLRPELVASAKTPLSSDSFSPFGRHDGAIHNKEVENAWFSFIESVPEKLEAMSTELEDFLPDRFTRSLHRYGINLRHVGLIRSLSKSTFIASQALVEMITRIAKNYVRNRVRTSKAGDIKEIIVNHFNLLLGKGEASEFFWRFAIKTQIEAKFSKASLALSLDERKFEFNLRDIINKLALFQVLQEKIGVRFKDEVLEKFSLSPHLLDTAYPFKLDDIESIQVKVKHLLEPDLSDKIMAWIKENAADNNVFNPVKASPYMDKFNIPNTEVCHLLLNQAFRMLQEKSYDQSIALIEKATAVVEGVNLLPVEVILKIQYIKGCVALANKEYDVAYKHLICAYKIVTSVTRTESNEKFGRSDRPFTLLILNMIVKLCYDSGSRLGTLYFSLQFLRFWQQFPCNLREENMISLFGYQLPVAVQMLDSLTTEGNFAIYPGYESLGRIRHKTINADVQQHRINSLLMEQRSGLLSLASLMDRLDARLNSYLDIYPRSRASKNLHVRPQFIKANQPHVVKVYLYGAVIAKATIKNALGKVVFESDITFVDFTSELTLDLEPGEFVIETVIKLLDKRVTNPTNPSNAYISSIPPQNGAFTFLLGYDRKKEIPVTFIVPDDNPVEHVAVFTKQKIPKHHLPDDSEDTTSAVFYAINRLGEVWEMSYNKPIASKIASLLPWKVVQIDQSSTHCILLAASGEVFTWGSSEHGELGHGDTTTRPDPRLVEKLKGVKIKRVFAYCQRSFALSEDGVLYAWGRYAVKGHKSAFLPVIYDTIKGNITHVAAPRDIRDARDFLTKTMVFTTETGHIYYCTCDETTIPSVNLCDFIADRFIIECTVMNDRILALDAQGNLSCIKCDSNGGDFYEDKRDIRKMYFHGLPVTKIDTSVAETAAALTAHGDIYLEDHNREYRNKTLPRLFSEIRGHTISHFSCTRSHLIALPGPAPSLPVIQPSVLQQRKIMETVSGALTNTRLEVKVEDLVIKIIWASPLTKSDSFAVILHAVDPPFQGVPRYGSSANRSETQQEGEVWFSPLFTTDGSVVTERIRKFPLPTAASGSYYASFEVNDKEMAKTGQIVVDFTDPQMTLEPDRDEVMPGQSITWKFFTRSHRVTEIIQILDSDSDTVVLVDMPAQDDVRKRGTLTLNNAMEGCRYYAKWSYMYVVDGKPNYQFLLRSREVTVKPSQNYITEKDVLELNVSQSPVKPSSTFKVSWKLAPSFKPSYKEVLVIGNDSCKMGYADWMKICMPKQIMTAEGSVELVAPHVEGEYFVGIMLNGLGFGGQKVKTIPLTVDARAPDPVVEVPVVQEAPLVLAVNNNNSYSNSNNAGGHSQQLIEFASMKTDFASWKDFFVAAGVNNAEMYGQVANAINMPVALIPVADSFLIAKLGIVDMQDVEKILLKALQIRESRIAKMITGTK